MPPYLVLAGPAGALLQPIAERLSYLWRKGRDYGKIELVARMQMD